MERDGSTVCTLCGYSRGNVYQEPPVWHGTHTIVRKSVYDFRKHAERHLQRLNGTVDGRDIEKVRAVFPVLHEAFFKVAPHRKNFMSYGFVIRKLLRLLDVDTSKLDISSLKTPSKIRDCETYWKGIVARVDLRGIKGAKV